MTAGEKQSVASFREFTDVMLNSIHTKMLVHLESNSSA